MTSPSHTPSLQIPRACPRPGARRRRAAALAVTALWFAADAGAQVQTETPIETTHDQTNSIELGTSANAIYDSVAIGDHTDALGAETGTGARGSTAIGSGAAAGSNSTYGATAVGALAVARGTHAVALGSQASATNTNAIAIGDLSHATTSGAISIGSQSEAFGLGGVAIGDESAASGAGTVAVGRNAAALGERSVAIGIDSRATRANSVDIGNRVITHVGAGTEGTDAANVQQLTSLAGALGGGASIGPTGALVAPSFSIGGVAHSTVGSALSSLDARFNGLDLRVTSLESTSSGNGAGGAGTGSGAGGSEGTGSGGAAGGSNGAGGSGAGGGGAQGSGNANGNAGQTGSTTGSVVDGAGGATSIGVGSELPVGHALSVGAPGNERRITNVAAGLVNTDAVNLGQLNTTRDSAVRESKGYTDLRFQQSQARIDDVGRTAYSGVAMAMAMPNISPAKAGGTVVAAGSGAFQGYAALGFGVTYRSPNGQMLVNGAFAYSNAGGTAARVQVGYEF